MKTLYFKCTFETDVILNVKSATEGNNMTLDFIPGSNFLGIAATKYKDFGATKAWEVFHSGKVRFGDAHIGKDGKRSLRIPSSMFYPKMKKASDVCYIHHFYDRSQDHEDNGGPQQLKQCRNGFCIFANEGGKATANQIEIGKSFAIKSAYDRENRRSKSEAMYGYESINKGAEFFFNIEIDNDGLAEDIKSAITGEKHLGRSRTAQYGLCKIEECNYEECQSQPSSTGLVTIYADSRLIFIDKNNCPTFRPTIEQLGLDSGQICWSKSQIRTFQYSPWNYKRQCYDTDRCGIEKGSVIVIEGCTDTDFTSKYIGSYQNEGFGRVIYNPDFLQSAQGTNGKALYVINEAEAEKPKYTGELKGDTLLEYLGRCKQQSELEANVYGKVNAFVKDNERKFTSDDKFAAQWGTIRSIAMNCKDDELAKKIEEYIGHGVAKEKWDKSGRGIALLKFINETLNQGEATTAVINLAAEMAKRCRNNGK